MARVDGTTGATTPTWLKPFIIANNALAWLSAVIVMGILSYFIHNNNGNGTHVIYEEVIAVLTVIFWIPGIALSSTRGYRGHLLPLQLIFSYLWLTAFIFSAQDWSQDTCSYVGPAVGSCGLKHTVEAFNFLAFFFIFMNVLLESIFGGKTLFARGNNTQVHDKHPRPSTTSTAPSTGAHAV